MELNEQISILVVDDDPIVRFIHKKMVLSLDIDASIYEASNGEEALRVVKELQSTTLILLDINMPVMDGFQFIEAFNMLDKQYKMTTKILVVTSSEHPRDLKQCFELGISEIVSKPVSSDKLNSVITAMLEQHV